MLPGTNLFWKWLSVCPHRSIFKMFFLPNGHRLLQRINQPAAGIHRLSAVGGCNGDEDAGLSNFQTAKSMDNGYIAHFEFEDGFCCKMLHLLEGHRLVGFILKEKCFPFAGEIAHNAVEDAHRSILGALNPVHDRQPVDFLVDDSASALAG